MADFLDNNWLQQLSLAEGFTVAEAVDVIENFVDDGNLDTSDVDIFIAPPENDILTDEDSLVQKTKVELSRINRLPKDCPLSSKKDMQNESRGSFQCKIEKEDGIFVARWKDNSVVTVASTSYGIEPIASVKRFSQSEKKYLHIQQPFVIKQYNHHMGGTDLMDEDISTHRIGIRGKKWWWPLFTWLIDLGTTNAWATSQIVREQNDKTDILEEK
ncbi:piggyBac transposable element-derived protein 3-like [Homalodisca vitripennis]|uniref:piggyBac transposable element-derived protein 3-like n=1 Tax=Homalodisca vitripennis TaxID=197043 RepID=UPI001EEBD912|nr:piggyBac transposable element-derived protein 3-like [Homalodisca vitripennis]